MIFKHKDGELRIYDRQSTSTGYYATVLFTEGNMSFPLGRAKAEERIDMDRGRASATMAYSMGVDNLDPMPFTVSCKMSDQSSTTWLIQMLTGVTTVNFHALRSHKGYSSFANIRGSSVSTMPFMDSSKTAYQVETLWTNPGSVAYAMGYQLREVYFPPEQQTVSEGVDGTTLNINGLIYGDVSRIAAFSSGTTIET